MKNLLNIFQKKYLHFINSKITIFFSTTFLFLWIFLLFLLYSKSYFGSYSLIVFALILFSSSILYNKIDPQLSKKISILLFKKSVLKLKLKNIIFAFPLLLAILANILVLPIYKTNFTFNNIAYYEINIIQKIFSIYFFYFIFIILLYAIGKKVIKLLKLNIFTTKIVSVLFSLGLGFFILALLSFFLLLTRLLNFWCLSLLILILTFFSLSELKNTFSLLNTKIIIISLKDKFNRFKTLSILFCIFIFSFNFILAFKPLPITTDDLSTYYNVPQLYSNYQSYRVMKHHTIANMGQNTEMIYTAIISLLDVRFLIHFQSICLALCLIGFYSLLKEFFSTRHAVLGLLSILLVPWNTFYAGTAKVEMFLTFYSVLILYSALLYLKTNQQNYLIFLGVFSGAALGIKYNSGILIILVYLALLFIAIFNQKEQKLFVQTKALFLSATLALLCFSPWLIKNQIFFASPLYPFQLPFLEQNSQNPFKTKTVYNLSRKEEIDKLRHGLDASKKNSPKTFLKAIWNQSLAHGTDHGFWINFGFIPILVIPFYFLFIRDKKILLLLTLSSFYLFIWYTLEGGRPWYAFCIIMLLYALLPYLLLQKKLLTYFYISIALTIMILFPIIIPINLGYLIGDESIESYKQKAIPYLDTSKFINNLNLKPTSRIYLAGDYRVASIDRNDELLFVDAYLSKLSYPLNTSYDFFYNSLREQSFKYIIFSKALEENYPHWLKDNQTNLDEYLKNYHLKTPSIYQDISKLKNFLEEKTKLVYNGKYYILYKLQ